MTRPGTQVIHRETPPPRSAATDTGAWFITGLTEKGPAEPVLVTSLDQFLDDFGERQSNSILYDAIEAYFREGGLKAYVSRVLGPDEASAAVTLDDSSAADTLTVTAKTPGEWGNALNVEVVAGDAGGEFKLVISHDTDGELETSPSVATKDDAIAWADASEYVVLTDEASANDPAVVAATSLAGGDDDDDGVTNTEWGEALDRFTRDLGPGQVSAPGRTGTTAHGQLLDHAAANNRFAILDSTDTTSKATLLSEANAVRSHANRRHGGLWGPWVTVLGLTGGTVRTIPFSPIQAGLIARSDGAGNSQNVPAAGENGQSVFALDVRASFTDDEREDLNEGGVNIVRLVYGGVRSYGYRTLTNPTTDANWINVANVRLYKAIVAKGEEIAERYVFSQIDGRRIKINQYGGDLAGMLVPYYDSGSLYGATPEEAFNVDVGAQVNTSVTIAANELRAVIALRISPFAELVVLELVKVATEEAVV